MDNYSFRRSSSNDPLILYLNARSFPLERKAEVEAAHRTGLGIVLATNTPKTFTNFELDYLIEAPIGNYSQASEIIINYIRSNNLKIEGIIGWTDKEVELVAMIAEKLGLPSTSLLSAKNVRNKVNTRKLLEQLPGANPHYRIIHDEEDFIVGLNDIGTPCLLKPAGSSGGRGIFWIYEYENALETFHKFQDFCSPDRDEIFSYYYSEALLEEVLLGSEHSVAGAVVNGNVVVFAILDKKIDRSIPFQYENTTPSKLAPKTQQAIVEMVRSVIPLTGINWCGFHVDLIVTELGEPKILEVGGRLGGECINSHLIPLAIPSLNPYESLMHVVQGRNPFHKADYTADFERRVGIRAILPPYPGKVLKVDGFEQIQSHPDVHEALQLKFRGDRVTLPNIQHNSLAIGYVVASCELRGDISELLQDVANMVTIEVSTS